MLAIGQVQGDLEAKILDLDNAIGTPLTATNLELGVVGNSRLSLDSRYGDLKNTKVIFLHGV